MAVAVWAREASPWGGLSVFETKERREAVVRAGAERSQETRRRREAVRR